MKSKEKKKVRLRDLKVRNVVMLTIGVVIAMFITDGVMRGFSDKNTREIIRPEGTFAPSSSSGSGPANTVKFDPTSTVPGGQITATPGFKTTSLSAEQLHRGDLAIIRNDLPGQVEEDRAQVNLQSYSNEYYSVADSSMMLNTDAARALNQMMSDYHSVTGLDDFVVYGTTYSLGGAVCPKFFAESVNGNCVDLALLGYSGYIGFDGFDEEGWVVQNCAKYGFIVRYPENKSAVTGEKYCPWHLRYVGKVHAAVMAEQGLCLEEYIEFLKGFTAENPYKKSVGSKNQVIYTIPAAGETTTGLVPNTRKYEVSGDNMGTYIISITN